MLKTIALVIFSFGIWRGAHLSNILDVAAKKEFLTEQELIHPGPFPDVGGRCVVSFIKLTAVIVLLYACFHFFAELLVGDLFSMPDVGPVVLCIVGVIVIIGERITIRKGLYRTSEGVFFKYTRPTAIHELKWPYRILVVMLILAIKLVGRHLTHH